MQGNAQEIETIVRLVVERLRAVSAAPTPVPVAQEQPAGLLQLDAKLVTFDCLSDRLDGVSVLRLPPQAIVTPLVADELKDRRISIERLPVSDSVKSVASDPRLLLVLDAVRRADSDFPGKVIAGTKHCSADVGRILAHIKGGGQFAVWAADRPYASACAAAGNNSLRAVQLGSITEFGRAHAEVKPNLVIVDGQTWTAQEISQLGRDMLSMPAAGNGS